MMMGLTNSKEKVKVSDVVCNMFSDIFPDQSSITFNARRPVYQ